MISFIIIGRNEGWKLTKCIKSVFDCIRYNSLKEYEVIYVDSKSTDDSIERAKLFPGIRILQVAGECNAAIGRNIGAKESKGDVLFFIDGDMEVKSEFLPIVYDEKNGLIDNFVSGNWENYYYTNENELIKKELVKKNEEDTIEKVTGGLFLIRKKVWELVGGMNAVFRISEDIDLGLRLAKKKIFLLRKKEVAAKHHTIAYLDDKRIWQDLFTKNHLYGRSLLYRKNIYNKHMYSRLLRNDYALIILLLCILFFPFFMWYGFLIYFALILLRSKLKLQRFFYFILRDISSLFGLVLFFPNKPMNVKYQEIAS